MLGWWDTVVGTCVEAAWVAYRHFLAEVQRGCAYQLVWMMGLVVAFSLAMCTALCAGDCMGADAPSPARALARLWHLNCYAPFVKRRPTTPASQLVLRMPFNESTCACAT